MGVDPERGLLEIHIMNPCRQTGGNGSNAAIWSFRRRRRISPRPVRNQDVTQSPWALHDCLSLPIGAGAVLLVHARWPRDDGRSKVQLRGALQPAALKVQAAGSGIAGEAFDRPPVAVPATAAPRLPISGY